MNPQSAARMFRRMQTLPSTCKVERLTGQTFNGTDYVDVWTTVYNGACLVTSTPTAALEVNAGETQVTLRRMRVKLPADTAVANGDRVTVTRSDGDAGLVGKPLTVTDVGWSDWQVFREAVAEAQT